MANLQALPNELLLQVYLSAPDVRSTVCLSSTCRQLWDVWAVNDTLIAQLAIDRTFEHANHAYDLALMQVTRSANKPIHYRDNLQAIISEMERNETMCQDILSLREQYYAERYAREKERSTLRGELSYSEERRRGCKDLASLDQLPAGYYIMRQLVLAYKNKNLETTVLWHVERYKAHMATYMMLIDWMFWTLDDRQVRMANGLTPKPEAYDPVYSDRGEPVPYRQSQGWRFARMTIEAYRNDHENGLAERVDRMPWGYIPPGHPLY